MTAFVDESIRLGPDGFSIVAAVVVVGDLDMGRDFARPSEEPLLWLPDVVAGATAATVGGGPDYLARLGSTIERTDVDP